MVLRMAAAAVLLVLVSCGTDGGEADPKPDTWETGVVVDEGLVGVGHGIEWFAVVEVEGHRVGITGSYCEKGTSQSSARLHAMAPVGTRIHFDPGGDAAVCPDELEILEDP